MVGRKYRVALYLRLSRDDGNEESQSIQSQREILTNYVEKHNWYIVDEYVDDGYSGTNFERPNFKRLIEDIELGKIDIVITKDLSRLGRNYIQVGYYTEEYFPQKNIRYIALIDNFDSDKEEGNDFVPFKNVINEWYARDTSKKIRSILNNKAASGEPRNTVFPIFGYTYNESYERVPDSETAPIVKLIFKKFIELGSTRKLAEYLTAQKIKTPRYYNAIKYNYRKATVLAESEESLCKWSRHTLSDLLIKEEYLGVYKTAQTKSLSYKNKRRHQNKDCYIFEGRYEPIIDRGTWELVQKILKESQRTSVPIQENIFRGLIFCADCGKLMRLERRTNVKQNIYDYRYYCNNPECEFPNTISKRMIEGAFVREILSMRDYILTKESEFIEYASKFDDKGRSVKTDIERDLERALQLNEKIDGFISGIVEKNILGELPTSTYNTMMQKYKKEKVALEDEIRNLTRKKNQELANPTNVLRANELVQLLKELTEETLLQPYIIQKLVRKILIRTKMINNSRKNREIELTIQYYGCDEILKGFLTYEN